MKKLTLTSAAALLAAVGLASCASKPKTAVPGGSPSAEAPAAARPYQPQAGNGGGVQPGSQEDLAAAAGERVFFGLDSHALTDEARATLSRQAAWLARYPAVSVLVAGNADERGTREYNLALGSRRAAAARDYLVAQGAAASRIKTVSYGKERPIDAGSTEAAWARNRNARTVLVDVVGPGW